jgi:hypothetical protein
MRSTQHPTNNWVQPAPEWNLPQLDVRPTPITRGTLPNGVAVCVSYWTPSAEELAKLVAGQRVALWVIGTAMPTVQIEVHE